MGEINQSQWYHNYIYLYWRYWYEIIAYDCVSKILSFTSFLTLYYCPPKGREYSIFEKKPLQLYIFFKLYSVWHSSKFNFNRSFRVSIGPGLIASDCVPKISSFTTFFMLYSVWHSSKFNFFNQQVLTGFNRSWTDNIECFPKIQGDQQDL